MTSYPVPFSQFQRALQHFPRAHPIRVGLLILALTGARPSELEKMGLERADGGGLYGNKLYWRMGKNQKGWRSEPLPEWFLEELHEYRRAYPVRTSRLLHYNPVSLRRDLWKHRAALGGRWSEYAEKTNPASKKQELILQLKGFRKSFGCAVFAGYWEEFGDVTAAMEFTCARLGHSNRGITVANYLRHYKAAEVARWRRWLAGDYEVSDQARLLDYCLVKPTMRRTRLGDLSPLGLA